MSLRSHRGGKQSRTRVSVNVVFFFFRSPPLNWFAPFSPIAPIELVSPFVSKNVLFDPSRVSWNTSVCQFAHSKDCHYSHSLPAVFIFGALTTTVITDILKIMSGRLRPYFLTLCNPDQKSCNGMGMDWWPHSINRQCSLQVSPMLSTSVCPKTCLDYFEKLGKFSIDEFFGIWTTSRLSFPSLHASLSMYSAIFLAVSDRCWTFGRKDGFSRRRSICIEPSGSNVCASSSRFWFCRSLPCRSSPEVCDWQVTRIIGKMWLLVSDWVHWLASI